MQNKINKAEQVFIIVIKVKPWRLLAFEQSIDFLIITFQLDSEKIISRDQRLTFGIKA